MSRGKKGKKTTGAPAGSRPIRAAELIREELSKMLLRGDLKDPRLEDSLVTITEVRLSPDLYYASVYVSVFSESPAVRQGVLDALAERAGQVRRVLGSELRFRAAPELKFFLDESIAYGAKIEGILRDIREGRDVADDE